MAWSFMQDLDAQRRQGRSTGFPPLQYTVHPSYDVDGTPTLTYVKKPSSPITPQGASKRWESKDQPAESSRFRSLLGGLSPRKSRSSQSSSQSSLPLSPSPKRPLLGFRSWRVLGKCDLEAAIPRWRSQAPYAPRHDDGSDDTEPPQLCSSTRLEPWNPGPHHAECPLKGMFARGEAWDQAHGQPPGPDCMCGYWMLPEADMAIERGEPVVGAVMAWGRCVEHENGMRCEYMQIIGLLRDTGMDCMIISADFTKEKPVYRGIPGRASSALVNQLGRLYDVPIFETAEDLTHFVDTYQP